MNDANKSAPVIGFIGLGVMGEPMCRNLAKNRARVGVKRIIAFDVRSQPLQNLTAYDVSPMASVEELIQTAQLIFLSLPGGKEVEALVTQPGGLLEGANADKTIIDLSTTPVELTRQLAARVAAKGASFLDAPVARTRQAAVQGTLAIMAGGPAEVFARVEPYLQCIASDVTHCGGHGMGQLVKILNNMVLFQTVVALAEALSVARKAGLDGATLFDALTYGSADSFALRNHGMKALLPGLFPEQAFSTRYAAKDLDYALELADQQGLELSGAKTTRALLAATIASGFGDNYWPAVLHVIDPPIMHPTDS